MFAPFPEEQALEILKNVISELKNGSLQLEQVSAKVSSERNGQKIMLGAAVAQDFCGRLFILKTNSGIAKKLVRVRAAENLVENPLENPSVPFCNSMEIKNKNNWETEIFVDPVVNAETIEKALSENDGEIHRLTEKINELKNLRKNNSAETSELQKKRIFNQTDEEKQLSQKRSELCSQSLKKVYSLYDFYCADGKIRNLLTICGKKLPPTGTGDCCGPKILNYAYKNGLKILSMAEVFYDGAAISEIKTVPPCDERCGLILPEILGLKIIYRDKNIVVVNKQSGLLSVPGRGAEKQDCIVNRVKTLFPKCINQPSVHRLDMETSGLLVLAFDEKSHSNLNRQFENRQVHKTYTALLEGIVRRKDFENNSRIKWQSETRGIMELFFRLDVENRPHQIWDEIYGKSAVTEFEITGYENYRSTDGIKRQVTRVKFIPHTGRTHQLRLASADLHGFGHPISGDTLYGHQIPGQRLLLHAEYLSFEHPVTGRKLEFFCPAEF